MFARHRFDWVDRAQWSSWRSTAKRCGFAARWYRAAGYQRHHANWTIQSLVSIVSPHSCRQAQRLGSVRVIDGGEIALHRAKSYIGAPRPMKMGTTASRFPYDAAARNTFRLAILRCSPIQHYASWILRVAG
jgi:hypothetical protein